MNAHRILTTTASLAGAALIAIALFVAMTVSGGTPLASACTIVHPKTGDLNADGLTNSLDALSILFYSAELTPAGDKYWMAGADVNCDAAVNTVDASIILQVDAGLTTIRP